MANLTPEILNPDRIRNAAEKVIFTRGEILAQDGRVYIEKIEDERATCRVRDDAIYHVEIKVDDRHLLFNCSCDYAARGVLCKHEVAASLAVREHLRQPKTSRWKLQLNRVLQTTQQTPVRRGNPHPYLLFFSLQTGRSGYAAGPGGWYITPYQLPLSALPKDWRQNGLAFGDLERLIGEDPSISGEIKTPYQGLNPGGCVNCASESVMLANILIERARSYGYYTAFPVDEYLAMIATTQSPIYLGRETSPLMKQLQLLADPTRLGMQVTRTARGLELEAQVLLPKGGAIPLKKGESQVITSVPLWLLVDRYLFQAKNEIRGDLLTLFLEQPELIIPYSDEDEFLDQYYLPLAEQIHLHGETVAWQTVQGVEPKARLYLSDEGGQMRAQLRYGYGEYEVDYEARLPAETVTRKPDTWTLIRIQRKAEAEDQAYRLLINNSYGLKRTPPPAAAGVFSLRARTHPVDFLLHGLPRLAEDGFEIYGEEALKTARVNRNRPTISLNVSSDIDWFDVQTVVKFGDLQVAFKDIRRLVRKRERFVKLADGSIGEIPAEWLEKYKHLFALGEDSGNALRLRSTHLTLLDDLLAEADQGRMDAEFERRRQRLRDFSGIASQPLPDHFTGELRPYQKAGYDWLHFLNEFEFGGCLADDMGLGKTIQVLVFLQSLKEGLGSGSMSPQHASLVVVPRSLLVNWQREASRFTPDLRLLVYFDKDRIKDTTTFDQYDVVLTTYGVMLRDIDMLRKYTFNYILLDESQIIKNPAAQTGKAARLLQGGRRLVTTGTPIENSTLELWSQFSFLNPGLLGSLDYFREEFGGPIERRGDEQTAQFLRKMVFPFILRRTKSQVAPELPPRTERILYADMEPNQRKLYQRTRDYYRSLLMGMIDEGGMNSARMKILEGLLRLRQISNHPRLMDEHFHGESGKFEMLRETLETLRAEGHKALVFSQFVQMLRLVRGILDECNIPYTYLDGHTQNRQEQVDRFQNEPQVPFFLISLRAGGLGLNLTAADYVIHIDPWWNPAVEKQATDRTHRIGQDKPVFVYKLITRDSVEEKILQLQARKRDLVEQVISTESGFVKSLSREDVEILFSK